MRKVGMTQIFLEDGSICPVTVLEAKGGNTVLQVKTVETDGYSAYQLGFEDKKERVSTKAEIAHAKKAGSTPKRFLKEVRSEEVSVKVGEKTVLSNINITANNGQYAIYGGTFEPAFGQISFILTGSNALRINSFAFNVYE